MALTPAERAKRYREKLKNDPAKLEAQRKKQLQRLKKNQKKISELSDEEKIKKRKLWREQKKRQKLNRDRNKEQSKPISDTSIKPRAQHSCKLKYKTIKNKYLKILGTVEKLKTTVGRLRKQLYRTKIQYKKEIKNLEGKNNKLQTPQEVLEISLKQKYNQCQTLQEKRLLRSIGTTKLANPQKHVFDMQKITSSNYLDLENIQNVPVLDNIDLSGLDIEIFNSSFTNTEIPKSTCTSFSKNIIVETIVDETKATKPVYDIPFQIIANDFENVENLNLKSFQTITNEDKYSKVSDLSNRKRVHILNDITFCPNKKTKTTKAIVVSKSNRKFYCTICKTNYPFRLDKMVICKICKIWSCISCVSKPYQLDSYICGVCKIKLV